MNLRSAIPAMALSFVVACQTPPPQGPNEKLDEVSSRNIESFGYGEAAAKATNTIGMDLMTYVIGDELLNHTSDEAITQTAQLAERYADKLGWEVNAEDRGRGDLTRNQRFIDAHMYISGALSALEEKDPEEYAKATAQIEKLRGLLKDDKFDEAVTLMHTHDPITGMGMVPGEGELHYHLVTNNPSETDKAVGEHSHGPDFGQHEHPDP